MMVILPIIVQRVHSLVNIAQLLQQLLVSIVLIHTFYWKPVVNVLKIVEIFFIRMRQARNVCPVMLIVRDVQVQVIQNAKNAEILIT